VVGEGGVDRAATLDVRTLNKKINFSGSTIFKLFRKITGNSINKCHFQISKLLSGAAILIIHPRQLKFLATPLTVRALSHTKLSCK
jgi:hypothetical protein